MSDTGRDGSPGAEERLRALVHEIDDRALVLLDRSGLVESWNRGAERMFGHAAGEILGRPFALLCTREDVGADACARTLRLAGERGAISEEGERVRKDGSRFWCRTHVRAQRDGSRAIVGFAIEAADLTAERAEREGRRRDDERFRLMIENVEDYAIFMLGADGRVATWNEGARRIKGWSSEEIVGAPYERFFPEEDARAGKPGRLLRAAAEQGRVEDEGWRVRKDGSRFWADAVITALRDESGRLRGFAKVTRDLTARRKAEEERVRLERAREAIRLRDEFLSIASHELKTPVTALRLQLQALIGRPGATDPALRRKLDRANESAERLVDLIESLLDVSRIATGRFELHPEALELAEAVQGAVDRLAEAAARAGCTLSVAVPPGLIGLWDRLRLEQVVTNLVSNAIKYAAGTPVRVTVTREGGGAVLEVTDGGPGVAHADLERIFGRFERAAPARNYGGLGLGLHVARTIVEAHGGAIAASNAPGGGATFRAWLPFAPAGHVQRQAAWELH